MFWLRSKENKFQLHTLIWGLIETLLHENLILLKCEQQRCRPDFVNALFLFTLIVPLLFTLNTPFCYSL